jgi:hypothetical protein
VETIINLKTNSIVDNQLRRFDFDNVAVIAETLTQVPEPWRIR